MAYRVSFGKRHNPSHYRNPSSPCSGPEGCSAKAKSPVRSNIKGSRVKAKMKKH